MPKKTKDGKISTSMKNISQRRCERIESNMMVPGRLGQGQQKRRTCVRLHRLAEWTGLEPATPGVTGRYSNQLNYHSASVQSPLLNDVVGAERLELPTYAL